MEPESEPLSAIQFVEDTSEAIVDKEPDWDRESDWSDDTSIAWSEDEDERLCNEVLQQNGENPWPLVNQNLFECLTDDEIQIVQRYFLQNYAHFQREGVFFNLDHEYHGLDNLDRAMVWIEETLRVVQHTLWLQLENFFLQLNIHT